MIIISNTSPITNLAAVNQLNILKGLYGQIIIPQAVWQELVGVYAPVPGTHEVQTLTWIETQQVTNHALVVSLQQDLDSGEAEAIALALEIKADLILLDERRGYRIASQLNLKAQGTLGVLLAAKARGIIPMVKPIMNELIGKAGFWVGQEVYGRVLQIAGEV